MLVCLAGCAKFSAECELIVVPRLMLTQGSDENAPAFGVRLYAWYIDEKDVRDTDRRPFSYADADSGIARHRVTGEVRSHDLAARQSEEDGLIRLPVTSSPVLLVAVDPVHRLYAFRTFKYQIPLEEIRIPVSFKIWRGGQSPYEYRENEWVIRSELYDNPPQSEQAE
jgi:hypothetical protein